MHHSSAVGWPINDFIGVFVLVLSHAVKIWRLSCVVYTDSAFLLTVDQPTFLDISPLDCRIGLKPWCSGYQLPGYLFALFLLFIYYFFHMWIFLYQFLSARVHSQIPDHMHFLCFLVFFCYFSTLFLSPFVPLPERNWWIGRISCWWKARGISPWCHILSAK